MKSPQVGQEAVVRRPAPRIVLASGSTYRASVLADAGFEVSVEMPEVDERSFDGLLIDSTPAGHAVRLARAKAEAVAARLIERGDISGAGSSDSDTADTSGAVVVVAADQLGVLGGHDDPGPDQDDDLAHMDGLPHMADLAHMTVRRDSAIRLLHKCPTLESAVEQLMALSGSTHQLVNGIVVLEPSSGRCETGVDVMTVTMRPFSEAEARDYVERFEPYDTAGSYRIEDQELMASGRGFVISMDGEDQSGVLGMPLPLLRRLLSSF